ncbi:MAG: uracil-DNA glycosylase, partial [Dehalococcoidia bacterium]|nr:uracil-DNA glycosylase [Dehalococcoidia bacterium]
VCILPDSSVEPPSGREGIVTYTAQELIEILEKLNTPEAQREFPLYHAAKKLFVHCQDISLADPGKTKRKLLAGPPRTLSETALGQVRLALGRLTGKVAACTACRLHFARNKVVLGEGNPAARIMIVGEGPGRQEDTTGRPFVGKAGKTLDHLLASINLSRQDVYITNTVKCRARNEEDKDRTPAGDELIACRPFLKQQLMLIRPELVVALGKTALNWFFPDDSLTYSHGKLMMAIDEGFPVFATYHPAASFYKPEIKVILEADFKSIPELEEPF